VGKIAEKIKSDNERGARQGVLEDLFYDFNRSRVQIYKMNFVRGIFFGLGSVLGGTLFVALLIWILSLFGDIFPPLAHFVNGVIDAMQHRSS
jgi:hypothetical protein